MVDYLHCHHVGCKAWRHGATATIREPLIQRGNYIAAQLVVDQRYCMAGVLTLNTAGLRSEWLAQESGRALGSRTPE